MAHNRIHVNSSTGLSLNDRFTAMAERTTELRRQRSRSRSRSRSLVRELPPVNPAASHANRRLLLQLERRHKMLAAMRVKRKSLRPAGAGYLKRGSIKAMRVAANGRPIKANSLTKVATMKADLVAGVGRRAGGRPLRRADSASNISQRLGVNRAVGGAAERIERRRLARLRAEIMRNAASFNAGRNGNINSGANAANRRGRSRSRTRLPVNNRVGISANLSRGRSRSRSRNRNRQPNNTNGRSRSRNRLNSNNSNNANVRRNSTTARRGRSMSRNRDIYENLPVKARLGVRPVANGRSNSTAGNRRPLRSNSINRRNTKVIRGRVDRRRGNIAQQRATGNGGRVAPARGRSRSRLRKGQQGPQTQQRLQGRVGIKTVGRRGRSRSRQLGNNNNNNYNNKNNINGKNNNRKGNGRKNGIPRQQQQPRRGRSRSRRRDGRNLGTQNSSKPQNVNKDELDKELDQYMATTRTENDLDFLLKN